MDRRESEPIDRLNEKINASVADPKVWTRIAALAGRFRKAVSGLRDLRLRDQLGPLQARRQFLELGDGHRRRSETPSSEAARRGGCQYGWSRP